MKKYISALAIAAIAFVGASPASAAVTIKGAYGETFSASTTNAKNKSIITVTGKRFDETVGIYLGFCVLPETGKAPSPCGGGINKKGIGGASHWISSNPPPYAIGLTEPFLPGGRFSEKISISKMIGRFDCTKVKCALTVRADHLRGEDRSYDLFIPISISK